MLSLQSKGLLTLPPQLTNSDNADAVAELKRISALDLSYNSIPAVQFQDLRNLRNVTTLNLSHNRITQLAQLGLFMPNLQTLVLNANFLTSAALDAADLSDCTHLQTLLVIDNRLTEWPQCLSKLLCLDKLSLAGNEIDLIPDSIVEMVALRVLSVANNKQTLDGINIDSLQRCKRLQHLSVYGNDMRPDEELQVLISLRHQEIVACLSHATFAGDHVHESGEFIQPSTPMPITPLVSKQLPQVPPVNQSVITNEISVYPKLALLATPPPPQPLNLNHHSVQEDSIDSPSSVLINSGPPESPLPNPPSALCAGCKLPIETGGFSFAFGFNWHDLCYVCSRCSKVIKSERVFLMEDQQRDSAVETPQIFDQECHDMMTTDKHKCVTCGLNIDDTKYVSVGERYYHTEHFQCKVCCRELNLQDGTIVRPFGDGLICDDELCVKTRKISE